MSWGTIHFQSPDTGDHVIHTFAIAGQRCSDSEASFSRDPPANVCGLILDVDAFRSA
jgi:hypothetical protein